MGETYYVGVDLGTSRTSIATSTGVRMTTISCVGHSKDIISRKRLGGRDYLLGQEALDNRLALDMVWPLATGVIKETEELAVKATGLILRDIVHRAIPDLAPDDKIFAAVGVPAQASITNKKAILEVTRDFVDKLLIISEPFAVAYGLDRLDECMIVDIGAGTVDLCRVHGSLPEDEDQLTLDTAGNFLDGVLSDAILAKFPDVQLTKQIIKRLKEKHGYVTDLSDPVEITLTEKGIQGQYDITDVLREAALKMTDPICAAVQKLVGEFDPDFQEKLRNNIIIAGGGSRLRGIDRAVEKGLKPYGGGDAICVQDAEYGGAIGGLKISIEFPEEMWEKIE